MAQELRDLNIAHPVVEQVQAAKQAAKATEKATEASKKAATATENGDPVVAAKENETVRKEKAKAAEAQAEVEIGSLLAVVHVLHADQVHVMFRAKLPQPHFGPSPESLEVALYSEQEIPWQDIAFRSVDFALRRYLEDRRAGHEQHHFTAIDLRRSARG